MIIASGHRTSDARNTEERNGMVNPHHLGEFALIDWIRQREPTRHAGSWTSSASATTARSCDVGAGSDLLVTTDMLMDGRHFRLEQDGPEAVGYKALGVNLSDIAAMAGIPRAAVVAVALPRDTAVEVAQGLHAGMRALADRFGVDLVGGDTNAWDGPLVISVTLLGEATARGAVRRAGRRPGDAILVTGPLGGSLLAGRHLRPEPRIAEALALHRAAPIHAMIDLSDGLSSDLGHILDESGGLGRPRRRRRSRSMPMPAEMSRRDGVPALDHALNDGEDFELCLARRGRGRRPAPGRAPRAGPALPRRRDHRRRRDCGSAPPTDDSRPIEPRGFDHFRDRVDEDDDRSWKWPDPRDGPERSTLDLGGRHRALGRALAELVEPGVVIGLVGPLGAGKTRLVRAIAEALGVDPGGDLQPHVRLDPRVRRPPAGLSLRRLSAADVRRPSKTWASPTTGTAAVSPGRMGRSRPRPPARGLLDRSPSSPPGRRRARSGSSCPPPPERSSTGWPSAWPDRRRSSPL